MRKTNLQPAEDETLDTFYHGRILAIQKKKGYRFSVDAPLLADFIQAREGEVLLELGGGNGIISLLVSRKPCRRIVCLEIQQSLAGLARRNIRLNGLEEKIRVVRQDLRRFRSREKFDVIFSNPPYISRKSGHLSLSQEKSVAKHEIKCDIFDIMHLTEKLLKRNGRSYFIYPAKREKDFTEALERNDLNIKRLRFVYPRRGSAARWLLAECGVTSSGCERLAPLHLYDDRGDYTPEAKRIFLGEDRVPHL
jgi:tRNA1Val (adenine37-N6)-methyltransferase